MKIKTIQNTNKTILENKAHKRTFSRTSLSLCLCYLLGTALCVVGAHITNDFSSYLRLLLLPISLQLSLVDNTGLMGYFMDVSWSLAYFFLVPPMLLALTVLGNMLSVGTRMLKTRFALLK